MTNSGHLSAPRKGNEPMPTYGLDKDFPLLHERAMAFDFAERLGGSTSALDAEIDAALRELWSARQYVSQPEEMRRARRV